MPDLVIVGRCEALRVHGSIARSQTPGASVVDLSAVSWFTPAGIVATCGFVDRQVRRQKDVVFVAPANPDISAYLARMHLGDRLDEMGVFHDLPFVPERRNSAILELHSFGSEVNVSVLAEHIRDAVAPQDKKAAKAMFRALTEAGENVEFHSGLENGFLAAQTTLDYGRTPILRFAVGDSGRKFRANLKAQGAETDGEALRLAFVDGISSTGDPARHGLRELSQFIRSQGGTVTAESRDAAILHRAGRPLATRTFSSSFKGSIVEGVVPLASGGY